MIWKEMSYNSNLFSPELYNQKIKIDSETELRLKLELLNFDCDKNAVKIGSI